ncbi:hypothetical protein [Mesorhizobium sophorae]|uniref:hypothetical protein n=1 Tax=Mesorhizobium sophorae TaxID=1300294 RepID=UPI00117D7415|nr:hypothetical protein [Mesorhizobium sophorae]
MAQIWLITGAGHGLEAFLERASMVTVVTVTDEKPLPGQDIGERLESRDRDVDSGSSHDALPNSKALMGGIRQEDRAGSFDTGQ